MSAPRLKWLHAADLHLETPIGGLGEVPEPLRELLQEAPYRAAQRIFDTAIEEQADFVLFSGDVVDPQTAPPWAAAFLDGHFRRLADHNIPVYWVTGHVDDMPRWSSPPPFQRGVYLLAGDSQEQRIHQRDGQAAAHIVAGRPADPGKKPRGRTREVLTIGAVHAPQGVGTSKRDRAAQGGRRRRARTAPPEAPFDYLALGGRHQRKTVTGPPGLIHYPGTHQGRSPHEAGPRGCTIVEMGGDSPPELKLVDTDVVRWIQPRIEIESATTMSQLESVLHEQLDRLAAEAAGPPLLVDVTLVVWAPLLGCLSREHAVTEILAGLRRHAEPHLRTLWPAALSVEPAGAMAAWVANHQTVPGDVARLVDEFSHDDEAPHFLHDLLPDAMRNGDWPERACALHRRERKRVVLLAGALVAELLGLEPSSGDTAREHPS